MDCRNLDCENKAEFYRIDKTHEGLCFECLMSQWRRFGFVAIRAFKPLNEEITQKYLGKVNGTLDSLILY